MTATTQTACGQPSILKMQKIRRRKWFNRLALTLALLAMGIGLFWLIWILWTCVSLGFHGLSWDLFTQDTPPPGETTGGLRNALFGTVTMVLAATCIGTPIGILAGIYLAEYGQNSRLARVVSFVNDILLSGPSIVIGLLVYAVLVINMGHYSAVAGVVALAILQLPIVIRTSENMLKLVPNTLREAAYALGAPKWKVITKIALKAAKSGILTGVLLSVARIVGETAPLLFTVLSNQFWSADPLQPMSSLPVTIFNFAMTPDENQQKLAWAGVLLITLGVLCLNVIARVLGRNKT
jgi:phosphate transport system permease protein